MERFFILDQFNTWYDWRLILTAKDVTPPEPKTNYVEIDGMSGSLDLSEALTGEVTYSDRTISATFWTNEGTRREREALLREIRTALHGKKIRIIEPDDPDHYFYGRVQITDQINIIPYAEFEIECICEPWRYALTDSVRRVELSSEIVNVIIRNEGVKTLNPLITVNGYAELQYGDIKETLSTGEYKIGDIKLRHGFNVIKVSGSGSITFTYKEAEL